MLHRVRAGGSTRPAGRGAHGLSPTHAGRDPSGTEAGPDRGAHGPVPDGARTLRPVPCGDVPDPSPRVAVDPPEALVSTDLVDASRAAPSDRATHARRALVLLAVGVFQVWLWTTRLVNLLGDPEPRTTGFVVVHAVLYLAAFGAAFVLLGMGWRMRREARA